MIIWAALCVPCLQNEKISSHQVLLLLPPSTAFRDVTQAGVPLLHLCSCTPRWGWKWVGRICLQLRSDPCAQFAFQWFPGVGNREMSCMTWFAVFTPASGWPHSLDNAELGEWCCVLYAFRLIFIIHYMLCLSQPWLLTLYMALAARRPWEDNWNSLGRHILWTWVC